MPILCLILTLLLQDSILNGLQSIVEIVTYGDRHDPSIFEYGFLYYIH